MKNARPSPAAWAFLKYLALLAYGVFFLFPLYWLVLTALKTQTEMFSMPPVWWPEQFTLGYFREILFESSLGRLAWNSVVVAAGSTLLSLFAGTLGAYSLSRFRLPFRLNRHISFWILSTRAFPPIVSIVPLYLILRSVDLVDTRLGLVLAYAVFNLPFVVWMMKGFFDELPPELEESALVDGDTPFGAFWRIILPLVRPGLAATALFCLIVAWNEFLFALVLTQSEAAMTLPVGIANQVTQYEIRWGAMSAAGVMAMIPLFVVALLVQRHLVRGLSYGAVKG
ncbi:MAG: carbohydrate ABC transporter permease [Candidatus Acidiferrales bacterium]